MSGAAPITRFQKGPRVIRPGVRFFCAQYPKVISFQGPPSERASHQLQSVYS